MDNVFSEILLHVVWKISSNSKKMTSPTQKILREYLSDVIDKKQFEIIEAAVTDDHIHILIKPSIEIQIKNSVFKLMDNCSDYLTQKMALQNPPQWDLNFGVVSVSKAHLEMVVEYIRTQDIRHKSSKTNATLEKTGGM